MTTPPHPHNTFVDLPKSGSRPYRIWSGMKGRCYNPKSTSYKNYGARGITVCEEWNGSFGAFWRDMGATYFKGATIDRKDNDKGYSKDNCRWFTLAEQQRHRRNNLYATVNGRRRLLAEWAEDLGTDVRNIYIRLAMGWPVERAVTEPVRKQNVDVEAIQTNNTSGFKGVTYLKRDKGWRSMICVNAQHINLGTFKTPEEAYLMHCFAALEL